MDFQGSNVVITGGASGIGSALAQTFAAEGANVVVADIDGAQAESVAATLRADGCRALPFACDVTNRSEVEALAAFALAALGRVNVLCNNAGVARMGHITQTRPNDFDWIFAVNVTGIYNGASVFAEHLKAAAAAGGPAHMVNTASEHALGVPNVGAMCAYTASKHAVLGMSDSLRLELAPLNVGVSILCPGPVATAVWDSARNRQPRFGGAKNAHARFAGIFEGAQDPMETARITVEAVRNGDFYILPHPAVRDFVTARYQELFEALDAADKRTEAAPPPSSVAVPR